VYFLRPGVDETTKSAYGTVIFYFGRNAERFRASFADLGVILVPAAAAP
jgi:hypothetical protein